MMQRVSLSGTDLSVSSLCLGNSVFGTGTSADIQDQFYSTFRATGGDCFDTAHCYCFWLDGGAGSSERELGECIRRHGDTGKVRVMTKGGHPDAGPKYPRPDGYLSPEVISSDIADSLGWLKMDAIDVYFLHRDDARVPVAEVIDCLNEHLRAGRLRALGCSNWSTRRVIEANEYAAKNGLAGFSISQPQFNLGHPNAPVPTSDPAMRYLTDADISWHESTGLPVACYSSTAGGYFASGGKRSSHAYDNPTSRDRLARATQLSQQMNVSINQIVIAYLLNQRFPVIPILGTSSLEHLKDAIGASGIKLTVDQVKWLRAG
jgi:aryl-alcohol dehydrogenase-like predicted oxidoreductase